MALSSQPRSSVAVCALAILLCVLVTVDSFAAAETVIIGGNAGWTFMRYGNMNLRRGDTLVFNYNPEAHNVLQVSQADYEACHVPPKPIKRHSSGKDYIKFSIPGTYYFICGVPDHCNAGMKVAVTVR